MTTTKPTLTLTLGAGPDTQGIGGSTWCAATEHEMLASGGTARGPRSDSESAWYLWARRQVVAELGHRFRFDWSGATVSQDGWTAAHGRASSGVCVTVTATRR